MKLIIVESPTKAKTISTFLGKEYQIIATMGHIRDLPKSELGVDVENNFEPKYVIPLKARKTIGLLKKESEKADLIILATDEDREGEAIAWHITQILNLDNVKCQMSNVKCQNRIVFHEITKTAIEEAIKNPRSIDSALVDAQQARRVLDRIVGYKLSPFLWKKVARRLSAGRVQSAAVKLVCDREEEIKKFIPQEHWTIVASLLKIKNQIAKIKNNEFEAILVKKNGKIIPKLGIESKEQAEKILEELKGAEYKIISIEKKEVKRNPLPPFTTSSLQQESWQKFHWPAKLTMGIAQNLYEHGLITYHRTDSLNLSSQALGAAKNFIKTNFGENYAAGFLRNFKTKSKGAQEAHEAIRPTVPEKTPENTKNNLEAKQQKLYDLIWRRFIACQMSQAIFDSTAVEIEAGNSKTTLRGVSSFGRSSKINPMGSPSKSVQQNNYIFRANGQILKFDGFLKVYPIKFKETELPGCEKDEILELIKLIPFQHFTQPPARYTEASLIKALEENGIGRPSTYAPILFTIQARNYVEKNEDKKFQPTEIGTVVNEVLTIHFPEIVDIKFTAQMEEKLDEIALGKEKWTAVIKEFYEPFEENLQKKYQEVS
ncbi:type I DNA topoisomerase, partial [Patescibacteria group bacterium]|nr:type I DNA topoisomerase [Patescibacteria group bacterium]